MTTSDPRPGERVADVRFDDDTLSVDLADGRTITVPLAWYPRLLDATPAQRQNWQPCGGGFGIHWPDIDENLSTQGLLAGAPAPRRAETTKKKISTWSGPSPDRPPWPWRTPGCWTRRSGSGSAPKPSMRSPTAWPEFTTPVKCWT